MSREKLIRILCVALVGTVLALALIFVVAVCGGMTAETPVPEEDPHFRPFFPEGSVDVGDIIETLDPNDFTRDPDETREPDPTGGDATLPPEPEITLPDWESGIEWPTLPPSMETDPDFEWPTLPEDWDTLPSDWDTLPEDWGDVEIPDDIGDLLAGMDGSLGLPPGALGAGVASQLTVMTIFSERDDTLYLKMQSFGNYTGQEWREAQAYGVGLGTDPFVYSALYIPHYLMNEIKAFEGYPLTITPVMDVRVIPYYITDAGDPYQIQSSDVRALGAYDQPYTLYYRPYATHVYAPLASAEIAQFEAGYAEFVEQGYLDVDDTTLAYMKLIIEEQGFDKNDPDIIEKVAAYIQNAATYNLAYNQNLDKEPNVALAFLGAYKEGVCRHYATAATLLYRALGIPARYTVGFMTDVTAGETTDVKGMDAHAWVEVYEEGFGWRYVEVTGSPSGETPGGDPGTDTDADTTPGTGDDPVQPTEPSTWGDLLAGTDGQFKRPASLPSASLNTTIFRIKADETARHLLKLKSFGDYTGQSWSNADAYSQVILDRYSAAYLNGMLIAMTLAEEHTMQITAPTGTFAAPYFVSPNVTAKLTVGDIRITGEGKGTYSVGYYNCDSVPAIEQQFLADYEQALREFAYQNYLYVDSETYQQMRMICLEQGWQEGDDLVNLIAEYVRTAAAFNVDYDPTLDSQANVVVSFLHEYKEGNSRHFASAATLLYRSMGIPARYTVGYLVATAKGETVEVKGHDAYAWVEVYVDGFGWMPVDVTGVPVTLPEPKQEVTLKPVFMQKKFDGTHLIHTGELEGFEAFEAQGYTYEATVKHMTVPLGTVETTIDTVKIFDPDGKDVTDRFIIHTEKGTLRIYEAELYFTGEDITKVYDGKPIVLTPEQVVMVSADYPDGKLPYLCSYRIIPENVGVNVGTGYAAYSVQILCEPSSGTFVDYTGRYIIHKSYGKLIVTPAALTVKAADAEKTYDGTALTADEITVTGGALADGDYIDSYTVEGSQTRVGRSENVITSITIRNAAGEDVTRNYAIETVAGTLKVTSPES